MIENLSKTERMKMLPEQVSVLKAHVEATDSKIVDLGKSMVRVETLLVGMKETIDKMDSSVEKNTSKLFNKVGALEKWRNWTTGIAVTVCAILGFFKDYIIDSIKKITPILILLGMSSCANVSSTRLLFKSEDSTLIVEMPKEVEAVKLKVVFNAQQNTFEITSDSWVSRNSETILSQAEREKKVLEGGSVLVEKGVEAGVRAAIKSAVPIP